MRLEYNPRAMCYNLYCDTIEENEELRRLLEKPITATDIKSVGGKIYADTDSIKTAKTKLNSAYGKMVTDTPKNYLVTDDYLLLVHKACLFAKLCEYDAPIIVESNFHFYNSPNCRSFSFQVDPASYKGNGVSTIMKAFNDR